jgi:hypothetical protein
MKALMPESAKRNRRFARLLMTATKIYATLCGGCMFTLPMIQRHSTDERPHEVAGRRGANQRRYVR